MPRAVAFEGRRFGRGGRGNESFVAAGPGLGRGAGGLGPGGSAAVGLGLSSHHFGRATLQWRAQRIEDRAPPGFEIRAASACCVDELTDGDWPPVGALCEALSERVREIRSIPLLRMTKENG